MIIISKIEIQSIVFKSAENYNKNTKFINPTMQKKGEEQQKIMKISKTHKISGTIKTKNIINIPEINKCKQVKCTYSKTGFTV